jgi:hypothetical protein
MAGLMMASKKSRIISWADWDELLESDVAAADVFCARFENPAENGNEIGMGFGFSDADNTLTRFGYILGATGSPLYRTISTSTGGSFEPSLAWATRVFGSGIPFSLVIKTNNGIQNGSQCLMNFSTATNNYDIGVWRDSSSKFRFYLNSTSGGYVNLVSTNTMIASTPSYYYLWWNGASTWRAGYHNAKITGWSDLPAGQRVEATYGVAPPSVIGSSRKSIFDQVNYNANACRNMQLCYIYATAGMSLFA